MNSLKDSISRLIETSIVKRQQANSVFCMQRDYFKMGVDVFQAELAAAGSGSIVPPAMIEDVSNSLHVSVPGRFVYGVEVIGKDHKVAALRIRRELAALWRMPLQEFAKRYRVEIAGNSLIITARWF